MYSSHGVYGQVEMHTGEPLFGGFDSHDQLYKIAQVVGSIPDHIALSAEKRERFFVSSNADSLEGRLFKLRLPVQYRPSEEGGFLETPPPRTLRSVIGVDSGGPSGRRLGERGHSKEHYELFLNLLEAMLKIDPQERVQPTEALRHPFLSSEIWCKKKPENSKTNEERSLTDKQGAVEVHDAAISGLSRLQRAARTPCWRRKKNSLKHVVAHSASVDDHETSADETSCSPHQSPAGADAGAGTPARRPITGPGI